MGVNWLEWVQNWSQSNFINNANLITLEIIHLLSFRQINFRFDVSHKPEFGRLIRLSDTTFKLPQLLPNFKKVTRFE